MNTSGQAIIRAILSIVGAWLIGRNLGMVTIDPVIWQQVVGVVLAGFSLVWAFIDKTVTQEKLESAMRQILIDGGMIFVAAGFISNAMFTAILGALPVLVSLIWSFTTRSKAAALQSGQIKPSQLKS